MLLVHGFGASAIWQWEPQAVELARDRRVVMPDLLGFGDTQESAAPSTVDGQVDALIGLLEREAIASVDLVGISYGGIVAQTLAAREPERVRRLVLLDTPGPTYGRDDYDALCTRFGVSSAAELLVPRDADGIERLLALGYARPPRVPEWAKRQVLEALYVEHARAQRDLLGSLVGDLARPAVERPVPRQPALVIWGAQDRVFPIDVGRELAKSLGAELELIAEAAHAPNVEHPRQTNALIRSFLDR